MLSRARAGRGRRAAVERYVEAYYCYYVVEASTRYEVPWYDGRSVVCVEADGPSAAVSAAAVDCCCCCDDRTGR